MLGLVLVLGLSGCGSTAQTPSDATGQTEVEPVADEADAEPEEEYDYSEYNVTDTDITMEELRAVNSPFADLISFRRISVLGGTTLDAGPVPQPDGGDHGYFYTGRSDHCSGAHQICGLRKLL